MSGPPRLLGCGEHAVLVELDGLAEVLALAGRVRTAAAEGRSGFAEVVEVVPAATTVLVVLDDDGDLAGLRRALAALSPLEPGPHPTATSGEVVEIEVRYDGPDLDEVARLTGLSPAEVVAAHTGGRWQGSFGGFAPGFTYLSGGMPGIVVPRRAEPRTSVPAGSVALAGGFSAVYPRSSPGGWQLIGTTDAVLFDVERDPPALVPPGALVRFVAVDR